MNDTVITGAAIGFLVFAALYFWLVGTGDAENGGRLFGLALVCSGTGAAIGWLVS